MAQFDLVGTRNYRRCRVLRGCIYTSRCRYMHMHMFRFCVLFFRKQFRLLKRTVRANTSRAHAHTKNENLKDMYSYTAHTSYPSCIPRPPPKRHSLSGAFRPFLGSDSGSTLATLRWDWLSPVPAPLTLHYTR